MQNYIIPVSLGDKILAKSYLKDDFFLLLRKLSKALWYICVILVFWEAEAGRLSLMPAWVNYVMRTFLEEKENRSRLCLSLSLCSRYVFYKWELVLTSWLLAEKLLYFPKELTYWPLFICKDSVQIWGSDHGDLVVRFLSLGSSWTMVLACP